MIEIKTKLLIIRVDGGASVGLGHLMRTIALAQGWQDQGGEVLFLCAEIPETLRKKLIIEGFSYKKINAAPGSDQDLQASCLKISEYARRFPVVVLDGYQFGAKFQKGLKKSGCRLLVLDDYGHAKFYYADWVLNQNIAARKELYLDRLRKTRLLLGTKFALLRREFLQYSKLKRTTAKIADKVLITFGGSDTKKFTQKIIETLAGLKLQIRVVVGVGNPHLQDIKRTIKKSKSISTKFRIDYNPPSIPKIMSWADFAISAGGSTVWELAIMRLPSLILVTDKNQKESSIELIKRKLFYQIKISELKTISLLRKKIIRFAKNKKLRYKLSNQAKSIVDGKGAFRICCALKNEKVFI